MKNLNLINLLKNVILETEPNEKGFFRRRRRRRKKVQTNTGTTNNPEMDLEFLKKYYNGTYTLKERNYSIVEYKDGKYVTTQEQTGAYQVEIQIISLTEIRIFRLFLISDVWKLDLEISEGLIKNIETTGSYIPKDNAMTGFGIPDGTKGDYAGASIVFVSGSINGGLKLWMYDGNSVEFTNCVLDKISNELSFDMSQKVPYNGSMDFQKLRDEQIKKEVQAMTVDGKKVFRDDTCLSQYDSVNKCFYQPPKNIKTGEVCKRRESSTMSFEYCSNDKVFLVRQDDGTLVKKDITGKIIEDPKSSVAVVDKKQVDQLKKLE